MRTKFLNSIAKIVIKYPLWVLGIAAALTVGSIILSTAKLQMNTDQDDLVSEKLEYHKHYKDYIREFGDQEYMYAVVETGNDLPKAKQFVKALAKKLETLQDIKEVTYQVSNPKLEKSFLLYIPTDQLRAIGEYMPKMDKIDSLSDVFGMMNGEIEHLPATGAGKENQKQLELGFRFLDKLLDGITSAAKDGTAYSPFLQQAFFASDRTYDEEGYLLSENGKLLFIMIMPQKDYKTLAVIEEPLKKIRAAIAETRKEFPDVKAGLTGRPVLAADEMSVSDSDMTYATIVALLIVTLIFIAYFRRPTRPAMAAVALMCGVAQTFGFITLAIGHLNILSIVFGVILVGAGIEFGLQIVSRYREDLAAHKNVRQAIETCITQTGKGNMTACAAIAASFFAMCLTDFLALKELGFIAGFGILIILANMFTLLPALMYLLDKGKNPEKLHTTLKVNLKAFNFFYKRPRSVIIAVTILSIAGAIGIAKIGFNNNLLELQARGLESVKYEKKIIEESAQSTWFVPFIVSSKEDSYTLAQKLRALPTIGKVETISEVVPEDQELKIKMVQDFKKGVSAKPSNALTLPDIGRIILEAKDLNKQLELFRKNLAHLTEMAFSAGETDAVEALEAVSKKAEDALQLVVGHEARIAAFEGEFLKDLRHNVDMLKSGFNPEPIAITDMPDSIRRRYVSETTGRYTVYAYPKEDIWDPAKMEAFIKDIRSIDPNVTGVPIEVYESGNLLQKSFRQAALFAMLAIIIIVAADFRKFSLAALALMPLGLGVFWLLELMGLFHIRFNMANFFGIPILLGIGVDNAVQIIHRYIKEKDLQSVDSVMMRSMGTAVLLTSLTTFASFGTLIFARHQGIASLGLIMTLGTLTCFIGSMIILPCALKLIKPSR